MTLADAVRKRMRYYLDKNNMSIWALFKASGIPRSTLCSFMNGTTELIKLDTLLLVETSARKLRYLMVNGNEYFCEGNISEMSHNLEKFGFFQIQRSYIDNM